MVGRIDDGGTRKKKVRKKKGARRFVPVRAPWSIGAPVVDPVSTNVGRAHAYIF